MLIDKPVATDLCAIELIWSRNCLQAIRPFHLPMKIFCCMSLITSVAGSTKRPLLP